MLGQSGAKQVLSCFLFLLLSLNCNIVKTNLNHFMNQMFFHPIKFVLTILQSKDITWFKIGLTQTHKQETLRHGCWPTCKSDSAPRWVSPGKHHIRHPFLSWMCMCDQWSMCSCCPPERTAEFFGFFIPIVLWNLLSLTLEVKTCHLDLLPGHALHLLCTQKKPRHMCFERHYQALVRDY